MPPLRLSPFLLALAVIGHPSVSAAQTPSDGRAASTQLPEITVSISFGSHLRTDYSGFSGDVITLVGAPANARWAFDLVVPVAVASVQVPLTKSVRFEGDFLTARTDGRNTMLSRVVDGREYGSARSSDCHPPGCTALVEQDLHESRSTLGAGGNLLWRFGPPRLGIFLGGGVGVQRTTGQLETARVCQAMVAGGCSAHPDVSGSQQSNRVTLTPRLLYGVEAVVAPRLAAFTTFRWGSLGAAATYDDSDFPGMSVMGGMRVALRTRPVETGSPEVTVTQTNGVKHRGRLVALTPDAVLLRDDGRDLRLPIADVRTVDKVGHHLLIGSLVGTALASAMWINVAMTRDTCGDCEDGPAAAALLTPVAIGGGAGIGALVKLATRDSRRLYPVPARTSLRIAPIMGRGLAGASMGVVW